MADLWLKIKLWTKVGLLGLVFLFLVILLNRNWNVEVSPYLDLVFRKYEKPSFLRVALIISVLSIFGWWLIITGFRTLRQFRQARERGRTERLEREVAEMKAKAAKLQTRAETPPPEQTEKTE
ncbi:MAG: DUF4190 domain-containing protein [Bacillota bacterium]